MYYLIIQKTKMAVAELETKPEDNLAIDSPEIEQAHESVLAVLLERQSSGYKRGVDNDGRKIGLTFDMGAYAGVISLAMAKKLETAGLLEYIDAFYGLSAGGVNAAFAATGQIKEGIDTYMNLMPDKGLVQLFPMRKTVMDLNVLREAITEDHPLKVNELMRGGIPVVIGITDMDSPYQRAVAVKSTDTNPEHPEQFIDALIRGCNYPILAGGPILDQNGRKNTDGGMAWTSAMELAAQDGCTHILSLANNVPLDLEKSRTLVSRPAGHLITKIGQRYIEEGGTKRPPTYSIAEKIFNPIGTYLDDLMSTLSGDKSEHIHDYKNVVRDRLEPPHIFTEEFYKYQGAQVERIYPQDLPELPGMLTKDKKRLRLGIKAARLSVRGALKRAQV